MTLRTHHARRPARKGWRFAAAWVGVVAFLGVWLGCTVTKENYATLSLFFDGVPDPNAAGRAGAAGDSTVAAAVLVHKPFAEEKCEACHQTRFRPGRNDPRACLTCHEKVPTEHVWTHGAVAGGACLWCHSPHESARKWLLRSPDRKLCAQCHSASMMNGTTVPAHVDPKVGCLECHFGHGGDNALMLKPGASASAPPPTDAAPAVPPEKSAPATSTPKPPPADVPPAVGPSPAPPAEGAK